MPPFPSASIDTKRSAITAGAPHIYRRRVKIIPGHSSSKDADTQGLSMELN
jgi:hypothetical protein